MSENQIVNNDNTDDLCNHKSMETSRSISDKEKYMRLAMEIAKTAQGHTSPNPMVGCVVVKNGRVISKACHERHGEYHAERNALIRCKEDTAGAELYVTLEPCCHYGKTPPCTEIIIEKGISRVYVACLDSNPLVAGQGIEILRRHGIEVETGILEEECRRMNEIFFHYIETGMPFVAVKYAMTLDGKIAAYTGDSKWITKDKTREHVHYLRKKYSAIMVGINTVLADNPMLNCRIEEGVDPIRIILDTTLRIPLDSALVKTAKDIRTIVVYNSNAVYKYTDNESVHSGESRPEQSTCTDRMRELKHYGVELLDIESDSRHIDIQKLMKKLGEMKIDSVLVEGGGEVNASVISAGIVNKIYAYIAPKIIMGRDSKSPVSGQGIEYMRNAVLLKDMKVSDMGEGDILIEGYCEDKKQCRRKES